MAKVEIVKPPPIAKTTPKAQSTPSNQLRETVKALLSGRYQDNGDGTVTDEKTSLQWMRFCLGQQWYSGTCVGDAAEYTWDAAREAAETLNCHGGYAGYQDWRLPTKEELLTLVYCSNGKPKIWNDTGQSCLGDYERPTINLTAFPNSPSSYLWSGSPNTYYSDYAWYVYFGCGNALSNHRYDYFYVRLVRNG